MFSICGSRYPSTTKRAFGLWVAVFSEDFFGLSWFGNLLISAVSPTVSIGFHVRIQRHRRIWSEGI